MKLFFRFFLGGILRDYSVLLKRGNRFEYGIVNEMIVFRF